MGNYYWNDWYAGWGWFLWFGMIFLIFSAFGNWGYTYSAHRKYDFEPRKNALDILKERYARGEVKREEFLQMKMELQSEVQDEAGVASASLSGLSRPSGQKNPA